MTYEDYPVEELSIDDLDDINDFLSDYSYCDFNEENTVAKFSSKERREFNV